MNTIKTTNAIIFAITNIIDGVITKDGVNDIIFSHNYNSPGIHVFTTQNEYGDFRITVNTWTGAWVIDNHVCNNLDEVKAYIRLSLRNLKIPHDISKVLEGDDNWQMWRVIGSNNTLTFEKFGCASHIEYILSGGKQMSIVAVTYDLDEEFNRKNYREVYRETLHHNYGFVTAIRYLIDELHDKVVNKQK